MRSVAGGSGGSGLALALSLQASAPLWASFQEGGRSLFLGHNTK